MIEQFGENFFHFGTPPPALMYLRWRRRGRTDPPDNCRSYPGAHIATADSQVRGWRSESSNSRPKVENQEKSLRRVPSAKARGRVPFEKRMLAGLWRRKLTLVLIIGCCDNSFRVADENWHYSDALSTQPFEPVRFAFSQSSSHSSKLKLSSGFVAVASIA